MTIEAIAKIGAAAPLYNPDDHRPRVELLHASELAPEAVRWCWRDWLAAGKLHILAGSAGTGKTTLATSLASILTAGGQWPDHSNADAGDVLMWSGEDSISDGLLPRFHAACANLDRVHFVGDYHVDGESRAFDPASDMKPLADAARAIPELRLLIIDPIVCAISTDSHKNAEVRKALQPLIDLAEELGCVLLGITHFTKNTKGRDPAERVTGSLAFAAAARLVMCTAKPADPSLQHRLVRAKSNIGPDGDGFEYALPRRTVLNNLDIIGQYVEWGNPIEGSAQMLLDEVESIPASEKQNTPAMEEATSFLLQCLADGAGDAKKIKAESLEAGVAGSTLRRAKEKLGIKSTKIGMEDGRWVWHLPDVDPSSFTASDGRRCSSNVEDAHTDTMSTFGVDEHLQQPSAWSEL